MDTESGAARGQPEFASASHAGDAAGAGGFFVNAPAVRATGVHDAASVAAVRWLQKLSGLPQTGAIDQTTWAYLSGLYTLTTGTGDPTPPR